MVSGQKCRSCCLPGSTRIYETIKREGILHKIINAGATILSASCGPCIGQWDRKDIEDGVSPTACSQHLTGTSKVEMTQIPKQRLS